MTTSGNLFATRLHTRSSFFKYVSAEAARDILSTRTLRWSAPTRFNDPFDVPINLELPCTPASLQVALAQAIAQMIEQEAPIPRPELAAIQSLLRQPNSADAKVEILESLRNWSAEGFELASLEEMRQHWARLRPDMRILCVSEANDIPSLWAHYAGSHTGAVLAFGGFDEVDSPFRIFRQVEYCAQPPHLGGSVSDWVASLLQIRPFDYKELFREYQYVKQETWAYEREWRLATYKDPQDSRSSSDWSFDARELKRLYLGARITEGNARELSTLLHAKFPRAEVFRARENQQTLKIDFEPYSQGPSEQLAND
jgi:hypothetical protein